MPKVARSPRGCLARDEVARRRFVTEEVDADRHENAYVGNWMVELAPSEADEPGQQLAAFVMALRGRREAPGDAEPVLVSISVLPWLE